MSDPKLSSSRVNQKPNPSSEGPDQTPPRGIASWFLLLMILLGGAMFSFGAPLPWLLISLLFSACALVVAIMLVIKLNRLKASTRAKRWAIVSIVFASFGLLMGLMALVFQPILAPYQDCVRSSVTLSGVNQCQSEYMKTLERISQMPAPKK